MTSTSNNDSGIIENLSVFRNFGQPDGTRRDPPALIAIASLKDVGGFLNGTLVFMSGVLMSQMRCQASVGHGTHFIAMDKELR
jgi:hypothetical protein